MIVAHIDGSMSREIRITIDDDEVFERMRHRKDELDLSWEDVLRRGLNRNGDPRPGSRGPQHHASHHAGGPTGHHSGPQRGSHTGHSVGQPGPHPGNQSRGSRGPGREHQDDSWGSEDWNPFDPDFGEKLSQHIMRSVGESVPFVKEIGRASLEAEIGELEEAEDATLVFPFLDDEPSNQVPLRVNLRTSSEGLNVEVVAVRHGKDAAAMNEFADDQRMQITKRLATGDPAQLRLRDGVESYDVFPMLTWSRDDFGGPTVSEVEIEDVRFAEA